MPTAGSSNWFQDWTVLTTADELAANLAFAGSGVLIGALSPYGRQQPLGQLRPANEPQPLLQETFPLEHPFVPVPVAGRGVAEAALDAADLLPAASYAMT